MKLLVKIAVIVVFFALCNVEAFSQFIKMEDRVIVAGYVLDADTDKPLVYTNISIRHRREGTISDTSGYFALRAKMYDTIRFSMLGYERQYIVVDEKATDTDEPLIVKLKTEAVLLPMVDIYEWRYKQLKYEITTMEFPDDDYIYALENFPERDKSIDFYKRNSLETFGLEISPITALYDLFSKEGKARRKLEELKRKDAVRALIEERISTRNLAELIGLSVNEAERFLDWCNFTDSFIKSLNAYDFVTVIKHKAVQYKQLNDGTRLEKIYLE